MALIADKTGADDVLHGADVAMYQAKPTGKDLHRLAGPEARARSVARLRLKADLRAALHTDGLRVHYQPIVHLDIGEVAAVEALVRWPHPDRGMLSPADFLPIAEDSGLVVLLGRWVGQEACRTAQRWACDGGLSPSYLQHVNLSAEQLRHGLVEEVEGVLVSTGFPAHRLCLKVTEGVLIGDADVSVLLLTEFSRRGVKLAVDDFG